MGAAEQEQEVEMLHSARTEQKHMNSWQRASQVFRTLICCPVQWRGEPFSTNNINDFTPVDPWMAAGDRVSDKAIEVCFCSAAPRNVAEWGSHKERASALTVFFTVLLLHSRHCLCSSLQISSLLGSSWSAALPAPRGDPTLSLPARR